MQVYYYASIMHLKSESKSEASDYIAYHYVANIDNKVCGKLGLYL